MDNLFKKKTGEEEENEGLLFNEYRASAWEDENVLEIAGHGGCTTMWIYLMPCVPQSYTPKNS